MTDTNGVAAHQLRNFVTRIENLEAEKKTVSEDIASVYSEASGEGFDKKVLRKVVALRKLKPSERQEMEAVMDLYMHALEGVAE